MQQTIRTDFGPTANTQQFNIHGSFGPVATGYPQAQVELQSYPNVFVPGHPVHHGQPTAPQQHLAQGLQAPRHAAAAVSACGTAKIIAGSIACMVGTVVLAGGVAFGAYEGKVNFSPQDALVNDRTYYVPRPAVSQEGMLLTFVPIVGGLFVGGSLIGIGTALIASGRRNAAAPAQQQV